MLFRVCYLLNPCLAYFIFYCSGTHVVIALCGWVLLVFNGFLYMGHAFNLASCIAVVSSGLIASFTSPAVGEGVVR